MKRRQFQVIPVIDVRHGLAVRAVAGDRANYRPLATALAPGTSDPVDIARGYGRLFPFQTLYLADLDGIEGRGADQTMQARVAADWGAGEVWVDDGSEVPLPPSSVPAGCKIMKVQGSESVPPSSSRDDRGEGIAGGHPWRQGILSLDFRGDEFLGPRELIENADLWPERVIVMTLARVGVGRGPDLVRLQDVIDRAGPRRRIYAAGGVSSPADLKAVRSLGAAGALVATALHNCQIKTGDLEEIAGESA